jgi:methionyl-tRNA synthetase
MCGSDEHGVPITIKATQRRNVTPQQVVDKYHGMMKNAFKDFGIHFSIITRRTSSSPLHHQTASGFL